MTNGLCAALRHRRPGTLTSRSPLYLPGGPDDRLLDKAINVCDTAMKLQPDDFSLGEMRCEAYYGKRDLIGALLETADVL